MSPQKLQITLGTTIMQARCQGRLKNSLGRSLMATNVSTTLVRC